MVVSSRVGIRQSKIRCCGSWDASQGIIIIIIITIITTTTANTTATNDESPTSPPPSWNSSDRWWRGRHRSKIWSSTS